MDDLVKWLRAQIDEDERAAAGRPHHRRREMLAQCEAYRAILDFHGECVERLAHRRRKGHSKLAFGVDAVGFAIKLLASAYQHRPGFRDEWRPVEPGQSAPDVRD